jgi:TPR repeat protein
MLDAAGEEGCTLEEALEKIFADWKRRGIAVETINLAADQGQADAQFNFLGLCINGEGVPQDYTQTAFWYRKAAEQVLRRKHRIYFDDTKQHSPEDQTRLAAWLRKAAEQGDVEAQFILGYLYDKGQGVPQDYTQAAFWVRKAAEQGYAAAQSMLGYLYLDGQGVPQDYAEAYFWYGLAAGKLDASDAEQVARFREEAASHLTPADLSRAEERARKWFEAHQAKLQ